MIKYLKLIYNKIKLEIVYRKRLREANEDDPYIYR